jgi:hypothetical protein
MNSVVVREGVVLTPGKETVVVYNGNQSTIGVDALSCLRGGATKFKIVCAPGGKEGVEVLGILTKLIDEVSAEGEKFLCSVDPSKDIITIHLMVMNQSQVG